MKPQGAHWGALVFACVIGVVALAFVAPLLMAPVPRPSPGAIAEGDQPLASEVPPPMAQALHARWYTQSVSPVIGVGETAGITIQFRNVGQADWIRGTSSEIRLGEVGDRPLPPAMKVDWLYENRPAVQQEAVVREDQLVTFAFNVAGATPGLYRLRLRPVIDGISWLEDEGVYVDITVR